MKKCSKCKSEKPIDNFRKDPTKKDGLTSKCTECYQEYYQQNRQKIIDKSKHYQQVLKPQENSERTKKYWDKNKKKIINYHKQRYNSDIQYKLRQMLRRRVSEFVSKLKLNKTFKTLDLLDCTLDEFKHHLESQFKSDMNWNNHGKVWEIDHIKPCSKFDLTNIEEQKQCFHYLNMQPLYKLDNRKKSNKYG